MRSVGIEAIHAYGCTAFVDVADIFAARGLDGTRSGNLMMHRKAVPLPCEDVVSLAASAAWPIVAALSPDELSTIRTLIVATESGVDFSKSASTYVHRLLGLSRNCRLFEVKQACHAGVAALRSAAALVGHEGGRALVIAGDIPTAARGTYAEPSQGAGAVAVLVGEPRVAELVLDRSGCHSYETADFSRPRADLDLVDIDLSLLTYIECLDGAFADYAMRGDGAHFVDSFDALAMHTPFPGMVKGAHRTVVRRRGWLAPAAIEEDFDRRVAASLRYPRMVGNIYSGSTLLAVASAIAHTAPEQERLGVFSYGGGCASEFFALRVQPGGHAAVAQAGIDQALEQRRRLTIAEYDTILDALPQVACGVQDAAPDLDRFRHAIDAASATRPIALLSAIKGYHRGYTWMKGGQPWMPEPVM
ncbi:hydroxymethylglutaryl-CoA synthase family protein [Catellatospora coxensis]|uniref:Polyketide biosynthesis 3-hydroxy-3-methylglutaryl-ACP synthase PksG n=1 Tax=Catellatospora coxensis TaxID=310354 RepID=A0A8J3L3M1_9ACTN|nr:hydroxymethylglutaryl-CoA synthase family protein [Catellatospora coxensis]GIG07135.1 polyketide biosynthesis 3-hydroxy-3-methylglutaryl-ACP synthase PksG [Catellatospora coxensis]